MIIRDLEHYEVDPKVSPIQKIKGGFFSFFTVNISVININNGDGDLFAMTQINLTNQIVAPIIAPTVAPSTSNTCSSCNEDSKLSRFFSKFNKALKMLD